MKVKFKCNKCEDGVLTLDEDQEDTYTCSGSDCDHTLELSEANKLFENGSLVCISDSDELNESVDGFENLDTLNVALTLSNEYSLYKQVLKESENDSFSIESFVKNNEDSFADIDFDCVNWEQIEEAIVEDKEESDLIRKELLEAFASTSLEDSLDEETKENILTIFEAAVSTKVSQLKSSYQLKYETKIEEATENIKAETEENINGFLDTVISEWTEENKVELEHKIRTELTDSFMGGMKELFEKYYIEIPKNRYDILDDLANKIGELEEKLDESKKINERYKNDILENEKNEIITVMAEGLSDTDKERLKQLSESLNYDPKNVEKFENDVKILRESFIEKKKSVKPDTNISEPQGTDELIKLTLKTFKNKK